MIRANNQYIKINNCKNKQITMTKEKQTNEKQTNEKQPNKTIDFQELFTITDAAIKKTTTQHTYCRAEFGTKPPQALDQEPQLVIHEVATPVSVLPVQSNSGTIHLPFDPTTLQEMFQDFCANRMNDELNHHEEQLKQLESMPDSPQKITYTLNHLIQLAIIYRLKKEYNSEIECLEKFISTHSLLPNTQTNDKYKKMAYEKLGDACQLLARSCFKEQKYEQAATNYDKAIKSYNVVTKHPQLAKLISKLGDSHFQHGHDLFTSENYEQAADCFNKALCEYAKVDSDENLINENLINIIQCHINLGTVCLLQKDNKKAVEHYQNALDDLQNYPQKIGMENYLNLTQLCLKSLHKAYVRQAEEAKALLVAMEAKTEEEKAQEINTILATMEEKAQEINTLLAAMEATEEDDALTPEANTTSIHEIIGETQQQEEPEYPTLGNTPEDQPA